MSPRARRGQTLVLFALALLLVVLMVVMTIGIGTRVSEKIEAQSTADAAAYSNAVVTARAYNAVSMLNRTIVSQMVSVTAIQSLISWSAYMNRYPALAVAAIDSMIICSCGNCGCCGVCQDCCVQSDKDGNCTAWIRADPTKCGCCQKQGDLCQARAEVPTRSAYLQDAAKFRTLEAAAAEQARTIQRRAVLAYEHQLAVLDWMEDEVEGGTQVPLATKIAKQAREASPWRDDPEDLQATNTSVGRRERRKAVDRASDKAVHLANSAMASRHSRFITRREDEKRVGAAAVTPWVSTCCTVELAEGRGNGYFADALTHGEDRFNGGRGASTEALYADDHDGRVFLRRKAPPPGCPESGAGRDQTFTAANPSFVRSTASGDQSDQHVHPLGDGAPAPARHNLIACQGASCPGIFPVFVSYSEDGDALRSGPTNKWGQPKNTVVVTRDLRGRTGARADPWELKLRVGAGTELDLTSSRDGVPAKVAATATAITYYHRNRAHWREPPTFFNPFWKGTLVYPDVDEAWTDRGRSTRQGLSEAGAPGGRVIRDLIGVGFRGLQ